MFQFPGAVISWLLDRFSQGFRLPIRQATGTREGAPFEKRDTTRHDARNEPRDLELPSPLLSRPSTPFWPIGTYSMLPLCTPSREQEIPLAGGE
jgi:hypothetical protein